MVTNINITTKPPPPVHHHHHHHHYFRINIPPPPPSFPRHHSGGVTGLVYSPSGQLLYSSASGGSLALYSSREHATPRLLRLLGNTVAKGGDDGYAPGALSLNQDGSRLAFIGPHNHTITVLEGETLNELLRLDITPVSPPPPLGPSDGCIDVSKLVRFSSKALNQLLVVTKGGRLLKFSADNGQLLSEVAHLHRTECSSIAVSGNGRYLLTAGDQVLKVRDYSMNMEQNYQVSIKSGSQ